MGRKKLWGKFCYCYVQRRQTEDQKGVERVMVRTEVLKQCFSWGRNFSWLHAPDTVEITATVCSNTVTVLMAS